MRRSRRGQTLVEFALIFPILLMFILGIVDVSYLVFNWSEVQFAARRGAEQASKLPPKTVRAPIGNYYNASPPFNQGYTRASDRCYDVILNEAQRIGMFSSASTINDNEIHIAFYTRSAGTNPNTAFSVSGAATARRKLNVIEIFISHQLAPLTPLGQAVFGDSMTFTSASRRTIVNESSTIMAC
jgi:Flp pilus assembly protein TadG